MSNLVNGILIEISVICLPLCHHYRTSWNTGQKPELRNFHRLLLSEPHAVEVSAESETNHNPGSDYALVTPKLPSQTPLIFEDSLKMCVVWQRHDERGQLFD